MNEINARAALDASVAGSVQPQADRLHWEREWLQQNRGAGQQRGEQRDSRHPAEAQAAAPKAGEAAAQPQRPAGAGMASTAPVRTNALPLPALTATAVAAVAAHARADSNAAAWAAWQRAHGGNSEAAAAANSAGAGQQARSQARQFALWQTGRGVGVALRLTQEEQRSEQPLQWLRKWLKEAGLKLAALIINGEVRWRSAPPRDGY